MPESPASPAGLKQLGPYEIVRKLGQGGMGTVYEAFDPKLRRKVALKVLNAGSTEPEDVLRFMREAESVARLRHPHCIHIYEMGSADGLDYFTMDLIEGVTLDKWAAEQQRSPREIATIIEKIALALQHAHENGVIHRDIKPSNIMVDGHGEPVVMDFGLARAVDSTSRVTVTGTVLGTPLYMSPEQAQGFQDLIGPRSDVWSVGAMLYELLAGRPPFQNPEVMGLIITILTRDPEPLRKLRPGLPKEIEIISLKCLEKDPDRRYASMKDLAQDLRAWLEFMPIRASAPSGLTVLLRGMRRRPAPYLAVAAGLLALLALGSFAVLERSRANFTQLVDMHHRTLARTVSKEVQAVLMPAESMLGEFSQWIEQGLVDPSDTSRLGALMAERLRGNPTLAWISYSDGKNGRYTGAQRDVHGILLLNRSVPSENEGRPRIEKIAGDGQRTIVPADPSLKGYDPRTRPFFVAAVAAEGMVWTEPYQFYEGTPGITSARAVRLRGSREATGVFTVDFGLDRLVGLLKQLELEYGCRMFLVDEKGKLVLRQGLKDPLLDACRDALKSGIEGEDLRASASAEAKLDGRQYVVHQERFALPGRLHWYLITAFER